MISHFMPWAHRADALAKGQDQDGKAPEQEQAGKSADEGVDADAAAPLGGWGG